jgi:hypothetical protein
MAPELCENKSFSGQLADIWAMGVTMFMLKFGHPPFVAKNIVNLYYRISNDPLVFPYLIDPGLRNLLEGLLEKDPEKRMTMSQIVAHPWFRFPPSTLPKTNPTLRAPLAKPDANQLKTISTPAVASNSSPEAPSAPGAVGLSFQPPPNYDEEEEAAMRAPIHSASINEVFMSIGGIRQLSDTNLNIENAIRDIDVDYEDDDDDDDVEVEIELRSNEKTMEKKASGRTHTTGDRKEMGNLTSADDLCSLEPRNIGSERNENMMNTNWGDDVFQIVDDGNDEDDGDDDDDVDGDDDDEDEKNDGFAKGEKGNLVLLPSTIFSTTHTEMSADEESRRSKQFLKKSALKKSSNQLKTECGSDKTSSGSSNMISMKSPHSRTSVNTSHNSFSASKQNLSPARNHSDKILGISRENNLSRISLVSQNDFDDVDAPEQLSNEEFSRLMDTLAQQPSKAVNLQNSSSAESFGAVHEEEIVEEKSVQGLLEFLIAPYQNNRNEVGCAYVSEQGRRPSQEDRFIVNTTLLSYFQEHSLLTERRYESIPNLRDQLSQLSLFGIFDGHSGSKTSQFLSHNFVKQFVGNEKFLESKTLEHVVNDAFLLLDYEVLNLSVISGSLIFVI